MGLYSVRKYVRTMLDGTTFPGLPNMPPLAAYMTPPAVEPANSAKAYVVGGRAHRSRQTAPRGAGFNKRPWQVDIYLAYMDTPTNQRANEAFDQIIDVIIGVVETQTMPVLINPQGVVLSQSQADSTCTQIQAIGEVWDLQNPPERMPAYAAHDLQPGPAHRRSAGSEARVSFNITVDGADRRVRFDWEVAAAAWTGQGQPGRRRRDQGQGAGQQGTRPEGAEARQAA